jgi:RimJ/RimL family protein N-acetyltransferase
MTAMQPARPAIDIPETGNEGMPLTVLETNRLVLRQLTCDDAGFILELLNDPSWIEFIGDKGVHDLDAAREYIIRGPLEMYATLGFGLYLVERKPDRAPIGLCGLIKRESLCDVDIGFAFLPRFRSKGYAYEAASAAMTYALGNLRLDRVVAITARDNHPSAKLLRRLGLQFEKMIKLANDDEEVMLFTSAG